MHNKVRRSDQETHPPYRVDQQISREANINGHFYNCLSCQVGLAVYSWEYFNSVRILRPNNFPLSPKWPNYYESGSLLSIQFCHWCSILKAQKNKNFISKKSLMIPLWLSFSLPRYSCVKTSKHDTKGCSCYAYVHSQRRQKHLSTFNPLSATKRCTLDKTKYFNLLQHQTVLGTRSCAFDRKYLQFLEPLSQYGFTFFEYLTPCPPKVISLFFICDNVRVQHFANVYSHQSKKYAKELFLYKVSLDLPRPICDCSVNAS